MQKERLKIATLNSWSGLNYHGSIKMGVTESREQRNARFEALIETVLSEDFDIVILNELNLAENRFEEFALRTQMDGCYYVGVSGVKLFGLGLPTNLCEADAIFAKSSLHLKYLFRTKLGGRGYTSGRGFLLSSDSVGPSQKPFFKTPNCSFHFGDLTQLVIASVQVNGKELVIGATHLHASPSLAWLHSGVDGTKPIEQVAKRFGWNEAEVRRATQRILWDQNFREQEIRKLMTFWVTKIPSDKMGLLAGDFNAESSWKEMEPLLKNGFMDCHKALNEENYFSWDATINQNLIDYYRPEAGRRQASLYEQVHAIDELEPRCIDYIFEKGLPKGAVLGGGIAFNKGRENSGGVEISDHFGRWVEIEI